MFGFLELLDASTWIERLTSALSTIDLMRDVLNVNIPSRCVRMIGEDICGALWDRMSQDLVRISSLHTAHCLPRSIRRGVFDISGNALGT